MKSLCLFRELKTEILLLFLTIGISLLLPLSAFSQDYYEKWSNIRNRYEYYDTNGNMRGYKKYSNINRRWEYHKVNPDPIRKPTTYNPYTSTTNAGLVNQVLAAKQSKHDYNVQKIQNKIDELGRLLKESGNPELQNEFSRIIKEFNSKYRIDYSNNSNAMQVMNYFISEYNNIVNNSRRASSPRRTSYANIATNKKREYRENSYVKVSKVAPIRDAPKISSNKIGTASSGKVLIIKKVSKDYYKVKSGQIYGYILGSWLKEEIPNNSYSPKFSKS